MSCCKQNINSETDCFEPLKYFNFLAKIFLSAPFSMKRQVGKRKFSTISHTNLLYILICLSVVSLSIYMLYNYFKWGSILRVSQALFNILSIIVIIFVTFLKNFTIVEIMRKMLNKEKFLIHSKVIDHKLNNYNKIKIISLVQIFIIISLMIITLIFVISEYSPEKQIVLLIVYIIPNGIIMFYICQYVNYIIILKTWLKYLNSYLKKLYYLRNENEINVQLEMENKIIIAKKSYITIFKLTQLIQKYFQIPVLCIKATSFLNTTGFLYLFISSETTHNSTYLWIVANILKIFSLPFFCELCVEEVTLLSEVKKNTATYINSFNFRPKKLYIR